eukprot:CAMPEP_0195507520 /NCGR_PEP_ID=MMETSP0794_2-20130614/953_1 /TAXON_ID=515487 /ORGANISM="Stephanopyxis turris, Strain CCMP 815" /LENGTH=295 /DNA_ID=CAMNT_0040634237 /DNA_START=427 /DNA_END=1314 /DNA_ORIENTATION=-
MTAISTILSVAMLPWNLYIYASNAYQSDESVMEHLNWSALFISLFIVILAIGLGLFCSANVNSPKFNRLANRFGSLAGIALILFSTLLPTGGGGEQDDNDSGIVEVWEQSWYFYVGVASPCILGLLFANVMTTKGVKLDKPERVTVSVECCYQNVGIATSVAISMFEGSDRALAMCVPLFYGIVEAVVLGIYCIWAWKKGWTKAPKDEYFHKILINSYEVVEENSEDEKEEEETVNETELPVSETEFGDKSYSWQEDSQEKKSVVTGSSCATTDAETIREREKMAEELEPPSWIV